MQSPTWKVFRYHEETKHRPDRYARSPGFMDWETQPNPFRTWEGVTPLLLPLAEKDPDGGSLDLYDRSHNAFWDFTPYHIGVFLELSLGLSAWKSAGPSRWALRMNPSSGNLHPTEAHLILPEGLYHYNPLKHALEPRAALHASFGQRFASHFGSPGFLIGLSSLYWREAWKYGERALRYCHHDVGHALAALSFAGNLLGWKVTYLNAMSDAELTRLFGFDRVEWPAQEEERMDALCIVTPSRRPTVPRALPADSPAVFSRVALEGRPNRLSPDYVAWDLIDETAEALQKPRTPEESVRFDSPP